MLKLNQETIANLSSKKQPPKGFTVVHGCTALCCSIPISPTSGIAGN